MVPNGFEKNSFLVSILSLSEWISYMASEHIQNKVEFETGNFAAIRTAVMTLDISGIVN